MKEEINELNAVTITAGTFEAGDKKKSKKDRGKAAKEDNKKRSKKDKKARSWVKVFRTLGEKLMVRVE